jgi:hypothetical protein
VVADGGDEFVLALHDRQGVGVRQFGDPVEPFGDARLCRGDRVFEGLPVLPVRPRAVEPAPQFPLVAHHQR